MKPRPQKAGERVVRTVGWRLVTSGDAALSIYLDRSLALQYATRMYTRIRRVVRTYEVVGWRVVRNGTYHSSAAPLDERSSAVYLAAYLNKNSDGGARVVTVLRRVRAMKG